MSNAAPLGRFIWHELLTTDTAGAASFYPKVVPWRTQPSNMPGYTIWMAGGAQVGGLMALPPEASATAPHWIVYIGTPSVDNTAQQAQRLGAKILKAPADIPGVGRFAVLSDPQGATFALYTPGGGGGGAGTPVGGHGAFSWHELATTDVAAALRFYSELFGWTKGPGHDMGAMGIYQLLEHGGTQVGGMCNVQGPSTPASWLSYVQVADAGRAVAVAKGAGGRLLHGPTEVPGGSWIALFMDPQGGAFAVHELPRAAAQQKPATAAKPAAAASPRPAAPPAKPAAPPRPATAPAAAAPAAAPKPAVTAARPAPAPKVAAAPKAAPKKAAKKKAAKKKAAKKPARKKARKPARKTAKKPARKAKRTARRRIPRRPARRARGRRRR